MHNTQPISILLCALGGEGGGTLTDWLVETARHAGYAAQATSIPGVAQRTGATTYYLEVFPTPLAELKGVSLAELEAATTDNFFRLFTKAERSRCA